MGHRDFRDSTGTEWQAWDVIPRLVERRTGPRRTTPPSMSAVDRRAGADRRVADRRPALSDGLGQGWLCFESPAEKRRLSPIPVDWMECETARLEAYCRAATPARRATTEQRIDLAALESLDESPFRELQ